MGTAIFEPTIVRIPDGRQTGQRAARSARRLNDFVDTPWQMRSPISIWRTQVGAIEVHYKREHRTAWQGPFLREEQELLDNIAQ